jgi:hypothetical protein
MYQVFNAYPAVPGPINIELAWDVISGAVVRKDSLTASGFFAYRHGQDALIAILGKMPKMISGPQRMGCCCLWGLKTSWIFTIYPDFSDNATYEQRMA